MIETLQKSKFDASQLTLPSAEKRASKETTVAAPLARTKRYSSQQRKVQDKKVSARTKMRKVVNRRRRRRGDESDSSEEEGGSVGSSSDSEDSLSSDDTLSPLSEHMGEDDLEMFERLSEGSSTDDESVKEDSNLSFPEKSPPKLNLSLPSSTSTPSVPVKKGKRQIVLAANFNLASSQKPETKEDTKSRALEDDAPTPVSREQPSLASSDTLAVDDSLRYLIHKTGFQSTVHTVCCLVAEESYLMPLRMFMEWLQSCPIALTAKSQASYVSYDQGFKLKGKSTCTFLLILCPGLILTQKECTKTFALHPNVEFFSSLVTVGHSTQLPASRRSALLFRSETIEVLLSISLTTISHVAWNRGYR